tara:strand:+ start:2612 stop:3334 length:723 start_codon:yes stop_codon:yes gene_type:complete
MKLKTLCLICAGLFSTSLLADNHDFDRQSFQLGYERLDITLAESFEVSGNNFASATYGFKFTPYFGIELSALIPINDNDFNSRYDYYRDWDGEGMNPENFSEIQNNNYSDSLESDVFGNLSLLLDLPLSDNFSVFANVGYSTGSVDVVAYNFSQDNAPTSNLVNAINNNANLCDITGIEAECGFPVESVSVSFDGSGFSYGAGIRFSFVSNDNISIGYNSYLNTSDLEVSGWSVNYQWNF